MADSADLLTHHGVDPDTARKVIVQGMLGDQPLPLQGIRPQASAEARYSAPS